MSREYRLPSGKVTTDINEYLDDWKKLTDAVEQKLDAMVYAFDPGVSLCLHDGRGSCSLPLWVAKKIAEFNN